MKKSKTILKLSCLILLSFACSALFAQERTLTGTVTDSASGSSLAGATISIKGKPSNVTTDANGAFKIKVLPTDASLIVSFIGYQRKEVAIGDQSFISVKLASVADTSLNDVVVVGYGTQKQRDITGSMATVNLKQISEIPAASVSDLLRGQIPGLNVVGGSQRPGTLPTLNIRQQFDFSKDGGTSLPLVVIDDVIQVDPNTGKPTMDRFNQLDLSEIESITVVKDAAAAIYGARGSQGAIIVKTKRGQIGAPRISYSGKFETNNAVSIGKVMNAKQFGIFSNEFGRAAGWSTTNLYSDSELASMDTLNYDWLRNDWRAANVAQHSLDVSGGSDRATYFTGASFYTQGANLGSQDFKRWTYRAGTDVKLLSGLHLGATVAASNTNVASSFTKISFQDGFAVGGTQNDYSVLLHMPKYIPWEYNVNGVNEYISPPLSSKTPGQVKGNNSLSNWNYYALLNNGSADVNKQFNYNVNFSLQYDVPFVRGLSFKVNYGLSQSSGDDEQDMFPILLYQDKNINAANKHLFSEATAADWTSTLNTSNSRVTYMNSTSRNEQSNFFVTYDHQFGQHSLSAMFSVEKATNTGNSKTLLYDNPSADVYNGTSVSAGTLDNSTTITYKYEGGTLSYLGRLNYSFKDRYLLQFVFRTDASTHFAPENYWGFFPAVSAGWILSDEKFFKNSKLSSWINFLKIRADIGRTGTDGVSPWKWLQTYTVATDKGFGFGSNGGLFVNGITPGVTPNRDITWDKTTQRNFGLDMAFLDSRLSVTFDQYFNSTRNMLTNMAAALNSPISVGGAFAEQNFAGVNAWGSELSITWRDHKGDFNYSIGVNTGLDNYKTVKYFDVPFTYPSIATTQTQQGNYGVTPVWGFRTWKHTSSGDGILRTDADINNYWNYLSQNAANSGVAGAAPNFMGITTESGLKKGMLVYEDVGGQLDANSKTIAGPNGRIAADEDYVKLKKSDRSYGFTTNLSFGWKAFTLITQLSTSWGGSRFIDLVKQGTSSTNAMWAQPIFLTDMYDSVYNPNGKYPNLYYQQSYGGGTNSDFFMLPTFRMYVRSLSIGYALPVALVKKAKLSSVRVYLSGNNLWDFYNPYPKKYRNMYDAPNVAYPTLRTWAFGLNVGF